MNIKAFFKENNKYIDNKKSIYFLSFLLPFILLISLLISKEVFPFGDRCILRTDFYHQYFPFHAELQNKFKNFDSLFYTFNIGLGTNFLTLMAYYLICPFNLLLLFVSENLLLEYITFILVIKISLCSLAMSHYLMKRYNSKEIVIVFFSMFYAMSGYIAAYYWNIMWLDNVILFPLLVLGFENMLNGKKPFLFIITLATSLICNYYIGALTCIFFVIYFFIYVIIKNIKLKKIIKLFLHTALYSIIGVMIAGVILAPVILAFSTTASSDSSFPSKANEYFSFIEVLGRHLPFVEVENGIENWPNIFSGILTLPLLLLYFISKKYKLKEKIAYGILLIIFIASFSINILDFWFHLGKFPNSLPSRYSFIYIFIVLVLSIRPLFKFKSINAKELTIGFITPILVLLFFEKSIVSDKVGFYSVYFAVILLFIYFIIFLCTKNKKYNKDFLFYLTIIVICFELFINLYQTSFTTIKKNDYIKNTQNIKFLTNDIKKLTNDFYRVERATMKTKDDGAFLHFPSASIFSSSAYASGTEFYKNFGMEASTNAYSTTGSTPFMDSILSIKYKVYEEEEKNHKNLNKRYIDNIENVYLYQNLDTLPISFVLDNKFLEEFDYSSGNPATVQNNFSRTLDLGVMLKKVNLVLNKRNASYKVEEAGDYYVFVRDKGIKELTVIYPTTTKTFKNLNRGYFVELGYLEKDSDIEFRNDYNEDDLLMELFRFDFDTMKKVIQNINNNYSFEMIYFNETNIKYNIDAKIDGTCVITLPYDKGFSLYVDDTKVETKNVFDFFLAFDISKGNHIVELRYVPTGFYLGIIISVLGVFATLFLFLYYKNKDNKKNIKLKEDKNSDIEEEIV